MDSDEFPVVDMVEMDEWRRRNQQERYKMLDDYAKWLRERGVVTHEGPTQRQETTRKSSRR